MYILGRYYMHYANMHYVAKVLKFSRPFKG